VNDKTPEPPSDLIDIVFEPIKQQLKRDLKEWEKTKEGYSKGGKASAEKRSRLKQAEASLSKSTVTDTVTVNVTDTVKDNVKVKVIFNFRTALLEYGFNEKLVDDWLKVRKTKKATNTETALKGFISEIERRTSDINEPLFECVKNSWSGFKWEWVDNLNNKNGKQGNTNSEQTSLGRLADQSREFLQRVADENNQG
jgi:hypothetical protein